MSYFCVADGASAWFGGYVRGDDTDCLAAMKALAVIGIVLAILYAVCGAYHGYIGWKHTSISHFIPVCAAIVCIAAYSIQAAVYWSPINELYDGPNKRLSAALFLTQKAPTLVAIYIYWTLYRTVESTNSKHIVWGNTWLVGLLMAFGIVIQAIALGMVVSRENSQRSYIDLSVDGRPVTGERIWTATLAAQAIALLLLMGNAYQLYTKLSRKAVDKIRELRIFLLSSIATLLLLFLRTIFRAVSTVFAANHAHDVTQDYDVPSGDHVLASSGEGSTYTHLVWYNFGLDGLPVLLALGLLCVVPAWRVLPSRLQVLTSTTPYHGRPDVRVSASFDAARPRARPRTGDAAPPPTAQRPPVELHEQPDMRDQPPAYDVAPAYEERPLTGGILGRDGETVQGL